MNSHAASSDPILQLQRRLRESFDELWDNLVDPREALAGDGVDWLPLSFDRGGAAGLRPG